MGALLNADSILATGDYTDPNYVNPGETSVTAPYRFSTDEVIKAVQEVYDGAGFDAVQAADLQNLLEFWNIAPENNVGVGATVPGELHSDDQTLIATTLEYTKVDQTLLQGGAFEGDILDVLNVLYGGHGWDSGLV